MCTLSWFFTDDGLQLFFNRDEQRSRPKAVPPAYFTQHNAVYPTDPQGGGTWLALTGGGAVYCLLNNYQAAGRSLIEKPVSRGQVILQLLQQPQQDLISALQQLPLQQIQPFTLCYFAPQTRGDDDVLCINWQGGKLQQHRAISPLISSAVNLPEVSAQRLEVYQQLCVATAAGTEQYLQFHSSHVPAASALSVCMHRADAHTVSFSHISISGSHKQFHYADGAPCSNAASLTLCL